MLTDAPITDREFFGLPAIAHDGFLEQHREIHRFYWPVALLEYQYLQQHTDPYPTCEVRVTWIIAVFDVYAVAEVQSRVLEDGADWHDEEPVFILRPEPGACRHELLRVDRVLHATVRARICGMPGQTPGDPWKDRLVLDVRDARLPPAEPRQPPSSGVLARMFHECMDVPRTPRRDPPRRPQPDQLGPPAPRLGDRSGLIPVWVNEPMEPRVDRNSGWLYVYRIVNWDIEDGLATVLADSGIGEVPDDQPRLSPACCLTLPVCCGWSGPWLRMGNFVGSVTAALQEETRGEDEAPVLPHGYLTFCRDLRPPIHGPWEDDPP
jgi:hypothetical protein